MSFPQKSLFIQQKQAPAQSPAPPRDWGVPKSLAGQLAALFGLCLVRGLECGPLGLRDLVLVEEQIHLRNSGRAQRRVLADSRGCVAGGTRDNGGEVSGRSRIWIGLAIYLPADVQSPIGAGLRRQELLREGRRDIPAKSSATQLPHSHLPHHRQK